MPIPDSPWMGFATAIILFIIVKVVVYIRSINGGKRWVHDKLAAGWTSDIIRARMEFLAASRPDFLKNRFVKGALAECVRRGIFTSVEADELGKP